MRRIRAGFTLIEVLASTLLTAGLVAGASALYIQISDASEISRLRTAEGRHAVAVLDRVARDLEGAYLVRKPDAVEDRGSHPWLFVADAAHLEDGADRLRFVVLNHVPRSTAGHSADLAIVSYALRASEYGGYDLWRWVDPGLPRSLQREWPDDDGRGAVLAEGLASFSARFLTSQGEWTGTWDSTGELETDDLPIAAEIRIALLDPDALEQDGEEVAGTTFVRRVLMPVRPVDLTPESEQGAGAGDEGDTGGEGDEDQLSTDEQPEGCPNGTLGECAERNGFSASDLSAAGIDPSACASQDTYTVLGVTVRCAP